MARKLPPYSPALAPTGGRAFDRDLTSSRPRISSNDWITVQFETKGIFKIIDEATGGFRAGGKVYSALARANAKAAQEVQLGMVRELNRQIDRGRLQRPGNRLEKSIMNDRNVQVYANNFSVGIEDWLEESPAALYWRSIEEGMGSFSGRIMFSDKPAIGSPRGPYIRPGADFGNMRMKQFDPASRMGVAVETIGPYPAYHYSRGGQKALENLNMVDLYTRYLGQVGIRVTPDNRSSYFKGGKK